MNQRIGPITGIVRVAKTRWDDSAIFGTIDGDHYYGIAYDAKLGDELEICKENARTFPMSVDLLYVLQLSAGYVTGSQDGITREGVATGEAVVAARQAREGVV